MQIIITENKYELGRAAAKCIAETIRSAIRKRGGARIVVSTGTSQNETMDALLGEEVDWSKVEVFHLDEYIDLPAGHPASFRKYLNERIVERLNPGKVHYVNPEGDIAENIRLLSAEIRRAPIDLGIIGIGENAHIAFNDPPADFDTEEPYIIVHLDDDCKRQQVGEGWFATLDDVPSQAISMSVKQILACETIVSPVPDERKAKAVKLALEHNVSNRVPATALRNHPSWFLFLDRHSASGIWKGSLS